MLVILPTSVFSQDTNKGSAKADNKKVKIVISDFVDLDPSDRLNSLGQTIPYLLKAGFLQYHWLEVVLSDELKEVSAGSSKTTSIDQYFQNLQRPATLEEQNIKYKLDGTIIQIKDKIRVEIFLKDTTNDSITSIISSDSSVFEEDSILTSIELLAKRLASKIPHESIEPSNKEIRFYVSESFEGLTKISKYNYLEMLIPEIIRNRLFREKIRSTSIIRDISSHGAKESDDVQITGKYSIADNKIAVSAEVRENKSRLTFPIRVEVVTEEILDLPDIVSDRMLEIIRGRITSEGKWKDDQILFTKEVSAEQYFERGEHYYQSKDYDTAILMYRMAIDKKTDYTDSRIRLADTYMQQDKYESAILEYQDIIKRNDKIARVHYALGKAYSNIYEYEDAISELNKALNLAYGDRKMQFDTYKELGDVYFFDDQYEKAKDNYIKAKTIDNANPDIYSSLGQIYLAQDNVDDAIEHFKNGYNLSPNNQELKNDLAQAYSKKGEKYYKEKKYDQAIDYLAKTIQLDPKDESSYAKLGDIYIDLKQYDQAIDYLTKAIQLDPKYEWAYAELGYVYANLKQYDKVINYLTKAIQLDPKDEWDYRFLGMAYKEKGQYDIAIENLNKAIEIEPNVDNYYWIGDVYRLKKDYKKSIENLEKALALDPKYPDAYLLISYTYNEQKKHEEAIKIIEKAIKLIPDSEELYAVLGGSYLINKNYNKANENIKKALDLNPKYDVAYRVKSHIQFGQKEYENAIESAKKAIEYNPVNLDLCQIIIDSYHEMQRDADTITVLEAYLKKYPDDIYVPKALGFLYHECIYDYTKAYEQYKKAYDKSPTLNLSSSEVLPYKMDFAEANITKGYFDETIKLANEVLKDQSILVAHKLSMKLLLISALLFKGEYAVAFSELGGFIDYYERIAEDYERSWRYRGTKNYVKNNDKLPQAEKSLILNLIDILELKTNSEAKGKLDEFKKHLPETYKSFSK